MAFLLLLAAVPALSEIRSDQPLTPPVIGAAPARQESARVASDGTSFFAVWRTRAFPLAASARNTYLVYSRGEDDATLMAPRLFLRTLASPDPQLSPVRRHAVR